MDSYAKIKAGHPTDAEEMVALIKTWPHVILYGGAALGLAMRETLSRRCLHVSAFWDLRHKDLGPDVHEPYSVGDPKDTLVILCTGNTILQPEIVKEIQEHGYKCLLGDLVYQVLGCPLTDRVDGDECLRGPCRAIYCKKLQDIVRKQCPPKEDPPLFLNSVTFVINQKCSLGCKYCSSYMSEYPAEDRINFPKEQVIADIKAFFAAVDGVGTVTVMGGEPFLHPDLNEIIQAILDCGNFGVISISTNGVFYSLYLCSALLDRRVNVSFSNYTACLTTEQQRLFRRNTNTFHDHNIPYTIGAPGPYWIIPSTLVVSDDTSLETLEQRKKDCDPVRCMQVKNGIIYPCDFINAVHGLKLECYPDSYIRIKNADPSWIRRQLHFQQDADYYAACERCKGYGGSTSKAGEQGYVDMRSSK